MNERKDAVDIGEFTVQLSGFLIENDGDQTLLTLNEDLKKRIEEYAAKSSNQEQVGKYHGSFETSYKILGRRERGNEPAGMNTIINFFCLDPNVSEEILKKHIKDAEIHARNSGGIDAVIYSKSDIKNNNNERLINDFAQKRNVPVFIFDGNKQSQIAEMMKIALVMALDSPEQRHLLLKSNSDVELGESSSEIELRESEHIKKEVEKLIQGIPYEIRAHDPEFKKGAVEGMFANTQGMKDPSTIISKYLSAEDAAKVAGVNKNAFDGSKRYIHEEFNSIIKAKDNTPTDSKNDRASLARTDDNNKPTADNYDELASSGEARFAGRRNEPADDDELNSPDEATFSGRRNEPAGEDELDSSAEATFPGRRNESKPDEPAKLARNHSMLFPPKVPNQPQTENPQQKKGPTRGSS